jgi:hypothetical protein
MLDGVHEPAAENDGSYEEGETVGPEADHGFGVGALGDAEDDGDEDGEEEGGAEVGEHALGRLSTVGEGVCVDGGNEVEEAGDGEELGAVVGEGVDDGGRAPAEEVGEGVEGAGAELAGEAKDVEDVAGVGRVDFAVETEADEIHAEDGDEEQEAADVLAEEHVARAGDKPAERDDGGEWGYWVQRRCGKYAASVMSLALSGAVRLRGLRFWGIRSWRTAKFACTDPVYLWRSPFRRRGF